MPSNDIYTSETKETILPTRLYIKQHSITGLKYFGKTIRDPYTYLGSGTRWNNHIRKHGKEFVETLWVSEPYTDAKLIKEVALKFSLENNIVESNEWANLILENGIDGGGNAGLLGELSPNFGLKLPPQTIEHRHKISIANLGKSPSPYKLKPGRKYTKPRIARIIECPHCKKTGSAFGMKRWHFDNCKNKSTN